MSPSDEQLLERVRASDDVEAFRCLFEKYQPVLFRTLLVTVRDEHSAHDIVQETFLRVWQKRASLQPHLSLLAYLLRISRNILLDTVKHREVRNRFAQSGELPVTSGDDPEMATRLSMLEEELMEVVNHLPDKCRQIFLLSRMEGMSNGEIGAALGIRPKTVENQITRALKVLRHRLREFREL